MKKLKILVVEDNENNIKAAKAMLAEHELVIATGYDQAIEIIFNNEQSDERAIKIKLQEQGLPINELEYSYKYGINYFDDNSERKKNWRDTYQKIKNSLRPPPFDILLTDVMMPKGGYEMMNDKGKEIVDKQGCMPYGAYIALYAIEKNIKFIGIITSGDHHEDPFVFALDYVHGFHKGDLKVVVTNNCSIIVLTKDYKTVGTPEKKQEMKKNGEVFESVKVKNWAYLLNDLLKGTEK